MPAYKKPMELRELHGTANRNKQRNNPDMPDVDYGLGPAPDYFTEGEREVWDYLVSVMFKGVLATSDRASFELMAKLFYRFRYGTFDRDAELPALTAGELSRLDSLLGRYGMTPADRTKIVVPQGQKKSGFEGM